MVEFLSKIKNEIIGIFSKTWQKDKKLFVILIATLILIPLSGILFYLDELSNSKYQNGVIPLVIFTLIIGVLTWKPKKSRGRSRDRPRRGWTEIEKEEVRERQGGVCRKCGRSPPRWEYHHKDGNRSNNSLSNCEGLCPNCHSVKTHD